MPFLSAIVLGLSIGVVFGFALEKSRTFEPGVVIGQMQVRNFLLIKLWFAAIATALICVALLLEFEVVRLHVKPTLVMADVGGGLLFGVGMTLVGGCPAMVMAQIGAGYRDAWFAVLGGLVGVAAFCATEPFLRPFLSGGSRVLTVADISKMPFSAWAVAIDVVLFATIMALERLRPWRVDLGPQMDGLTEKTPAPPSDG